MDWNGSGRRRRNASILAFRDLPGGLRKLWHIPPTKIRKDFCKYDREFMCHDAATGSAWKLHVFLKFVLAAGQ
jgi:hypothetical protein